MNKNPDIKRAFLLLVIISLIIRSLLAATLELGNNEAYYWTFALYPDLSHIDHPPMLGWLIQLFTINLYFNSEFFIRLTAIVLGTMNIWLIFLIGRRLKDALTGYYSALLFVATPYGSIITGTFVMSDTPLTFFYLLSIYFLLEGFFPKYGINRESIALSRFASIISGVFIGLAMLSKFSAIFIWISVIIYAVINDRGIFKRPIFYISAAISIAILSPVLLWNLSNDFVNFNLFKNSFDSLTNPNYTSLLKESAGIVLFNNPLNIIIAIIAVFSFKKVKYLEKGQLLFLLSISIPIILIFLVVSLFRHASPNLSAPGFIGLILISASYLANKHENSSKGNRLMPPIIKYSLSILLIATTIGFVHVKTGYLDFKIEHKSNPVGKNDVTLDIYGWRQLSKKFNKIREEDIKRNMMNRNSGILSNVWYDAAHFDYYIASPLSIPVKTIAPISQAHKYSWITDYLGGFTQGESFYYLASSRESAEVIDNMSKYFKYKEKASIIYLHRMGKPVERFTVYRFKDLSTIPPAELCSPVK